MTTGMNTTAIHAELMETTESDGRTIDLDAEMITTAEVAMVDTLALRHDRDMTTVEAILPEEIDHVMTTKMIGVEKAETGGVKTHARAVHPFAEAQRLKAPSRSANASIQIASGTFLPLGSKAPALWPPKLLVCLASLARLG